jgi:hypothetical protein
MLKTSLQAAVDLCARVRSEGSLISEEKNATAFADINLGALRIVGISAFMFCVPAAWKHPQTSDKGYYAM